MYQKPKLDELIKMIDSGMSKKEIASYFKIGTTTLTRWFSYYKTSYVDIEERNRPSSWEPNEINVVLGSLLGDGWLTCHGRSKNARFNLKQSINRREYVLSIANQLQRFLVHKPTEVIKTERSPKPIKVNGKITKSTTEFLEASKFWTAASPLFTTLHEKWYPDGRKIVPCDLKLNSEIFSHWYVQDGSNYANKHTKKIVLCSQGFSQNENEFLVERLRQDLNIESYVYTRNNYSQIRIRPACYHRAIGMVRDFINVDCFLYKLDTSKASLGLGTWCKPKLDIRKAREIEDMYKYHNRTLKEIAELYDVAPCTIGKIVNNQMYKRPIRISGEAICKVIKNGNQK